MQFFCNLPLEKIAINCMCVYSNTLTHARASSHTHSDHQCCTKIQSCSCWGEFRVCVWTHKAVLPLMLQTVFPSINIMEMSRVFVLFFSICVCANMAMCFPVYILLPLDFGKLISNLYWTRTESKFAPFHILIFFFLHSHFKGFWKEKNFRIYK